MLFYMSMPHRINHKYSLNFSLKCNNLIVLFYKNYLKNKNYLTFYKYINTNYL